MSEADAEWLRLLAKLPLERVSASSCFAASGCATRGSSVANGMHRIRINGEFAVR